MMKKFWNVLLAFSLVTFTGCSNDDENSDGIIGEEAYIEIQLVNGDLPSRAPNGTVEATVNEKKVTMLEFYIFDPTGNVADDKVFNAATPTNTGYYKFDGTDLVGKKLTMTVGSGINKKMLVAANLNLGPLKTGMNTFAEVQAAIAGLPLSNLNSREIPTAGLGMSGVAPNSDIKVGSTTAISVGMTRLVSKIVKPNIPNTIEVNLSQKQIDQVWETADGVTEASSIAFAFKGYAIINGIDKSNIRFMGREDGNYKTPGTNAWTNWEVYSASKSQTVNASTFDGSNGYAKNYSGWQAANNSWFLDANVAADDEEAVFVYESKPKRKEPGYDPQTVVSLIIEGTLTANTVEKTRYWRINLTKDDYYHMMRNCVYQVKVNTINTPGHNTPKDAEEETPVIPDPTNASVDFTVSVSLWDLNSYESNM